MQIIQRINIIFIRIYTAIFLIFGLIGALALKSPLFFLIMVGVELVYLFVALRGPYRRYKAVKEAFPPEWRDILMIHSVFYRCLDDEGKGRFERDVQIFLGNYSVEGVRRGEVDLATKLKVAAGMATMLHGRPSWDPPIKDGVVIYPGERFNRHYERGRGNYAGMASYRGPLILTEGGLEESFRYPHDGYNVIYHEMAHYFDFEGGDAGGLPTGRGNEEKWALWRQIFTAEYEKIRQGRSFLRQYGGQNEVEFFAVAAESFFENPWEMNLENPGLYNAFKDFFNLDILKIMKVAP